MSVRTPPIHLGQMKDFDSLCSREPGPKKTKVRLVTKSPLKLTTVTLFRSQIGLGLRFLCITSTADLSILGISNATFEECHKNSLFRALSSFIQSV